MAQEPISLSLAANSVSQVTTGTGLATTIGSSRCGWILLLSSSPFSSTSRSLGSIRVRIERASPVKDSAAEEDCNKNCVSSADWDDISICASSSALRSSRARWICEKQASTDCLLDAAASLMRVSRVEAAAMQLLRSSCTLATGPSRKSWNSCAFLTAASVRLSIVWPLCCMKQSGHNLQS